ncbi:hypothetical protein [Actinocorallia longicatena]|uniref:Uncharacterized protein n=1 Tax=Actinocorallia longicatena TaxID=111803 RepID=A0ABP6QDX4_9ACTN
MRFTEAGLGLRSSVVELRHPGGPLRIVLFPMVHMADPGFYEDVTERMLGCDVVVMEGVRDPRRILPSRNEVAYRMMRWGRLRLTLQDVEPEKLGLRTVRPDDLVAFRGPLRRLRWLTLANPLRIHKNFMLLVGMPLVSLLLSRDGLARLLQLDFDPNELPLFGRRTVRRDEELAKAVSALHAEHASEPLRIAVVYGALHMPVLLERLRSAHGYRPCAAEWLVVFGEDRPAFSRRRGRDGGRGPR